MGRRRKVQPSHAGNSSNNSLKQNVDINKQILQSKPIPIRMPTTRQNTVGLRLQKTLERTRAREAAQLTEIPKVKATPITLTTKTTSATTKTSVSETKSSILTSTPIKPMFTSIDPSTSLAPKTILTGKMPEQKDNHNDSSSSSSDSEEETNGLLDLVSDANLSLASIASSSKKKEKQPDNSTKEPSLIDLTSSVDTPKASDTTRQMDRHHEEMQVTPLSDKTASSIGSISKLQKRSLRKNRKKKMLRAELQAFLQKQTWSVEQISTCEETSQPSDTVADVCIIATSPDTTTISISDPSTHPTHQQASLQSMDQQPTDQVNDVVADDASLTGSPIIPPTESASKQPENEAIQQTVSTEQNEDSEEDDGAGGLIDLTVDANISEQKATTSTSSQTERMQQRERVREMLERHRQTLQQKTAKAAEASAKQAAIVANACASQTAKLLQERLENCLKCPICVDIFHIPHTIQCGHTFCMSCLRSWLSQSKSCPTCRAKLTRRPIPVLAIRDLVNELHTYLGGTSRHMPRTEALPDDDIWADWFPPETTAANVIVDEDGIRRCPSCTWEIFGRQCAHCGLIFDGLSDDEEDTPLSDFNSQDEDPDQDDEDDEDFDPENIEQFDGIIRPRYRYPEDEESNLGTDIPDPNHTTTKDEDENDSFICSDNYISYASDQSSDHEEEIEDQSDIHSPFGAATHIARTTHTTHRLASSDDEDVTSETELELDVVRATPPMTRRRRRRRRRRRLIQQTSTTSTNTCIDLISDDEVNPAPPSKRRLRNIVILDDEEDDKQSNISTQSTPDPETYPQSTVQLKRTSTLPERKRLRHI